MYTATIKKKTIDNGVLRVEVEFSDGVDSVIESCIPQDLTGLKFWVKSRLATFNGAKDIDTTLSVNDPVDVSDPVVTPYVPTQAELDEQEWIADYRKWVKVKTTLIDTGVLTGNEAPVLALQNKVKTNFKASYLASI